MSQIIDLIDGIEFIGSDELLHLYLKNKYNLKDHDTIEFTYIKKSIDARHGHIKINLKLEIFINEPKPHDTINFNFKNVKNSKEIIIIGAGPAGLFAALQLIELGIKPIIFERGQDVKNRRRDLALITKQHIINPESNYCFGEGGAGTYSDGKLYTRSTKRGDINRILKMLVYHGADEKILYTNHPHIGTNKLPSIIQNIRNTILHYGGEIYFNKKLNNIEVQYKKIKSITLNNGEHYSCNKLILATGHSARDIFKLLVDKKIHIETKPFAMGFRIEHPQKFIDQLQYKTVIRNSLLAPASYRIVEQIKNRSVFSFCMCPGGIIAPAMTNKNEIVVNGWSPSKHNNPFANSGLVVNINMYDIKIYQKYHALAGMYFQQYVEQQCFNKTLNTLQAPAQRVSDFVENRFSNILPNNSYLPGVYSVKMEEVIPQFICTAIKNALIQINKKMKNYISQDAILIGVESRTSSPVKIPRNKETFQHIEIEGLYPIGEGAGYAGGIMSAALDGENCIRAIFS